MPVYDRSYRRWDGTLERRALRFIPIVGMGVRNALGWKGGWLFTLALRLFMGASCVPTALLFFINYLLWFRPSFVPEEVLEFLDTVLPYRAAQYPALTRFNSLFLMIYTVLFGSGLIARDRASGALPLYLSRPLTIADYIVGKVGVIGWFVAMFTLVPNLLLWLAGVACNPSEHALAEALPTLLPILLQNTAVILVYSLTILACSALCRRPMFAGLIWFTLVIFLPLFATVLGARLGRPELGAISPNDSLFAIGYQLFGLEALFQQALGQAPSFAQHELEALFSAVRFFAQSSPFLAWISVAGWCLASLAVVVSVLRRQDVVVEAGSR